MLARDVIHNENILLSNNLKQGVFVAFPPLLQSCHTILKIILTVCRMYVLVRSGRYPIIIFLYLEATLIGGWRKDEIRYLVEFKS